MSVSRETSSVRIGQLLSKRQTTDPRKHPDEVFDLLSIPAFDEGSPETVIGSQIGSAKLQVSPSDVLVSKIVPHIQRVWVVPPRGDRRQIASSEWIVLRSNVAVPDYLRYALLDLRFHAQFMATVDGLSGSLQRARPQAVKQIEIELPTIPRQRAIADYLDRETAQIDAFIAKNEELITLLTERRAAIIDEALVRAGANVPAIPLKRAVDFVTVGIVVTPAKWYVESGIPALRGLNVKPGSISMDDLVYLSDEGHQENRKSELRAGDVLVVRTGQAGAAAVVPAKLDRANAIDLLIVRTGTKVVPEFLAYFLNSDSTSRLIAHGSVGSIQGHFNVASLRELPFPLLPRDEQWAIVRMLDEQAAKIDLAIATARRGVGLARERRAALISAAVTGKIDMGVAV